MGTGQGWELMGRWTREGEKEPTLGGSADFLSVVSSMVLSPWQFTLKGVSRT